MIIGVDPGLTGGIAAIDDSGLWMEPMPRDEEGVDAKELGRLMHELREAKVAYVEKAQSMPKQSSVSTFSYGKNCGITNGVILTLGIPIIEIRPQKWMAEIYKGCPKNLEGKDRSLWAVKQIFPKQNFTLERCKVPHIGMVEAALIAEYGRRVHE